MSMIVLRIFFEIHSSRDRLRFDRFRRSRDLDRLLSRFDLFRDRLREREPRLWLGEDLRDEF